LYIIICECNLRGKNVHVVGEAHSIQTRREVNIDVWTFRLERFDDKGNRLSPVAVEMRGLDFEGFINEGDQIEVYGQWSEVGTVLSKEVRNLSTNSKVKAKWYSRKLKVVGIVVGIFLALFFTFIFLVISGVICGPGWHKTSIGCYPNDAPPPFNLEEQKKWLRQHGFPMT
jgi:hypothetical protein